MLIISKKKKNIPYLGKNVVFYCKRCSLPLILTKKCPRCGHNTEKIPITPPYDIRPAMRKEVLEIKRLIKDNLGTKADFIDETDIIMLNHVGSEDQMDEIVYNGTVIAIRRYDIINKRWILKFTSTGLSYLPNNPEKNWVMVDDGAENAILKGANVLIPGILNADTTIKKGDYILVINKNKEIIAAGISRHNGTDLETIKRGIFAKTYCFIKQESKENQNKTKWSWKEIAKWNEGMLQQIKNEAINFIRKIHDQFGLQTIVSFSGGKDSLVTLDLVYHALPKDAYKVLFIDTGLEFPETITYVKEVIKQYKLNDVLIHEKVPTELFWASFDRFGPPARDFRYCCKFAKLAPIRKALSKINNNGNFLCFVGQRRYESYIRSKGEIWKNQYLTNQINVSPIQNWNALMIWLYIFYADLQYNKLYEMGFERIGCWLCPSSNMAHFEILQETHEELYFKLQNAIKKWVKEHKLPSVYLDAGLWRFKKIPKKILNILPKEVKIQRKRPTSKLFLKKLEIIESECISEPTTIIGAFSHSVAIEDIKEMLKIYPRTTRSYKNQFLYLDTKSSSVFIYSDGTFKISPRISSLKENNLLNDVYYTIISIFRGLECTKCGLCIEECSEDSISLNEKSIVINEKTCIKCLKCFQVCPVVNIVHKNLKNKVTEELMLKNKEASNNKK